MSLEIEIGFTLNGVARRAKVPVGMSALTMLREVCGLSGTKYGCGEGECGACTIRVDGKTLASCLMFAADCDGRAIVTIEGMATDPRGQALQRAFVECGAVQCGFCTPGMVMSAVDLVKHHGCQSEGQVREALEGNFCRCTGYQNIVKAVFQGAEGMKA